MTKSAIILVGPPASGKTTFYNDVIVPNPNIEIYHSNRDEVRDVITDGAYSRNEYKFNREREVTDIAETVFRAFIDTQELIPMVFVSSDTNMNLKFLRQTVNHLLENEILITFKTFFDAPLEELLRRNNVRREETGRNVPSEAIEKMFNQIPNINAYINETIDKEKLCQKMN